MSKLLATMAPTAPPGDAFQIHQVVARFQTNRLISKSQKNFDPFGVFASSQNIGTSAINMRKVKGLTGHAANNNNPGSTKNTLFLYDFTVAR